MNKYAAFLRGINVGGNKKVPMAVLRETFVSMGFENVKTLLNSGNVVFETEKTNAAALTKKITGQLARTFGFEIKVILRSLSEIQQSIDLNPFKKIKIDKNVRLYITFLPGTSKSQLKLPYTSSDKGFQVLSKTDGEVFSVLTVLTSRSVDAMAFLEKEFGKDVTTRNWNTVMKITDS